MRSQPKAPHPSKPPSSCSLALEARGNIVCVLKDRGVCQRTGAALANEEEEKKLKIAT